MFADKLSNTDIVNLRRALTKLLSAHGWKPASMCAQAMRECEDVADAG